MPQDKKYCKNIIIITVLGVIIAALGLFVPELLFKQSYSTANYAGVNVQEFRASSEYSFIFISDEKDNARKTFTLRSSLVRNEIAHFDIIDNKKDDKAINEVVADIISKNNLNSDKIIMVGLGSAGHYALEGNYLAGIALIPYLIPSDIATPTNPVLIQGVLSDENSTPQMLTHVYNMLSGDDISSIGFAFNATQDNITLNMSSGVANSYASLDAGVVSDISAWLMQNFNFSIADGAVLIQNVKLALCALLLISASVLFVTLSFKCADDDTLSIVAIEVKNRTAFLTARIFVWIIALPLMLIIGAVIWLLGSGEIPIGILFALYLFGSGIVMLRLYRNGKVPGISGNIDYKKISPKKHTYKGLAFALFSVIIFFLFHFVGLYDINLSTFSLVRSLLYAVLCFPSLYIFIWETELLKDLHEITIVRYLYMFGMYAPLIALAIISIPIDQGVGFYSSIIYIVTLLYTLCMGTAVYAFTNHQLFSGVLISIIYGSFLAIAVI